MASSNRKVRRLRRSRSHTSSRFNGRNNPCRKIIRVKIFRWCSRWYSERLLRNQRPRNQCPRNIKLSRPPSRSNLSRNL